MTALQMDELGCYANRNPPPQRDTLLHYNATLGEGQSDNWLKKNKRRMYIRVPCVSKESMKQVATVWNTGRVQIEFKQPVLELLLIWRGKRRRQN